MVKYYLSNILDFENALIELGDCFWDLFIQSYVAALRPDLEIKSCDLQIDINADLFCINNIGSLYEIFLVYTNKISKKELGQYYTPLDVSVFLAKKFLERYKEGGIIADVCCGTGNLMVSILDQLSIEESFNLIKNKKLYLYDLDAVALKLAIMKICIKFLPKNEKYIYKNIDEYICCENKNFLSDSVNLPLNCFVISNPPYGRLPIGMDVWFGCCTESSKEMYAIFMEKISLQAKSAVIISPQSFLGSSKYETLRSILSNRGGTIYVFDNVPASIFNGKKYGIFNTNKINSVRAAITIINGSKKGFNVSPMFRFNCKERDFLFKNIETFILKTRQKGKNLWFKCPKTLECLLDDIKENNKTVENFIVAKPNKYKLIIPATPRYFISASSLELKRRSSIIIYAKSKEAFNLLYVILNSSISYWWWRICDGEITIKKETLLSIPVFDLDDIVAEKLTQEGQNLEPEYIITKINAKKINENIKLPEFFRKKLNAVILKSLNKENLNEVLYSMHSNSLKFVSKLWA